MSGRRRGRASQALTARVLEIYGDQCWLQLPGCKGVATTKDHVVPYSHGGTDELENLRPACQSCNSSRRDKVISGYGATVKIITGPPAGGKTTYVATHARPGDVVVDLDALCKALTAFPSDETHRFPDHIRHVALGARATAIDRAVRLREAVTVWIIHSRPKPDQISEYKRLRYEIIECDPGIDVVKQRAAMSRPRESQQAVDTWYEMRQSGVAQKTPDAAPPSRKW